MAEACVRPSLVRGKLLPPKTEYVVFVRLAPCQAALYSAFIKMAAVKRMVGGGGGGGSGNASGGVLPLTAIQHLQKLCNSAGLLMGPKKAARAARGKAAPAKQTQSTAAADHGNNSDDPDNSDDGHDHDGRALGQNPPSTSSAAADFLRLQADLRVHLPRGPSGIQTYPDPSDPATPAYHPALSGKMAVLMHMLGTLQPGVDRTVVAGGGLASPRTVPTQNSKT